MTTSGPFWFNEVASASTLLPTADVIQLPNSQPYARCPLAPSHKAASAQDAVPPWDRHRDFFGMQASLGFGVRALRVEPSLLDISVPGRARANKAAWAAGDPIVG